jgi:hypothetical protein
MAYGQLKQNKGFNKSTISRIFNDPEVKRWLAKVLIGYPEGRELYRWLRIFLDLPTASNESLVNEWLWFWTA